MVTPFLRALLLAGLWAAIAWLVLLLIVAWAMGAP